MSPFRGRALVLVVVVSGLAGCGGTPASSAPPDEAQVARLYGQLSQCIREHGVPNFPDMVQDGNGDWSLPGGASAPPKSAEDACRSILDQISQVGRESRPASAADMAAWRKFAQCMRQQGVTDWPDPDPDGYFTLPARLTDPANPDVFKAQSKACESHLPAGVLKARGAK